MIFVTLGSQKFQFDRLLKAVDDLVTDEEIFAQIGYSSYKPRNYKYKEFLDREEFANMIEKADIIITHGGTGVIINAVKKRKKVIAVPRLAMYGEHVDDHQLQLVEQFKELDLIYACEDMNLKKAIDVVNEKNYKNYESNTQKLIEDIEEYINK